MKTRAVLQTPRILLFRASSSDQRKRIGNGRAVARIWLWPCHSVLVALLCGIGVVGTLPADEWPQFRGPAASGVMDGQNLPDTWDIESGENIRWQMDIPGLGHACPIVTGDRVFVVTAVGDEPDPELKIGLYGNIAPVEGESAQAWIVYCLSKWTGQVLWQRTLYTGQPEIKRHTKASHANCTPATDGYHLVVCLGSEGLFGLDVYGNLLWSKDLGTLDSGYFRVPAAQWGFSSSPIIHRDTVLLQCDIQKGSYLAAFRVSDGQELWRTPRDEVPTWSTPTVYSTGGRDAVVVNGFKHTGGYDFETGEAIWHLKGGGDIPVPTPILYEDLIILSSAHGGPRPLRAVKMEAQGDITPADNPGESPHFAWYHERDGVYMQTPIVYRDHLYACRGNGVLSCYDVQSGERKYQSRLDGGTGFTASPLAADGKIYFSSEDGQVYVVQAGTEFKLLATNKMGEPVMASPALSDGMLFVRTKRKLVAVGAPLPPAATAPTTPQRRRWFRWGCRR